jgi:hypothetical protein
MEKENTEISGDLCDGNRTRDAAAVLLPVVIVIVMKSQFPHE